MMQKINIAVLALCILSGCGQGKAQEKKPGEVPYVVPLFDGKPRTHEPPKGEYQMAALPNAKELFDMVMACYPEKGWFRGEFAAEARSTSRMGQNTQTQATSYDPSTGQYTTTSQGADTYVGLVFRIPLWSALELDKEREREVGRRISTATQVGNFLSALAEYQITNRELALYRSLEKRSQERVALGVAETSEQVKYLEKVANLDRGATAIRARLISARVILQGLCTEDKAGIVDEYLKRFKEVQ